LNKIHRIIIFSSIGIIGIAIYILSQIYNEHSSFNNESALPYFGPKNIDAQNYTISDFSFINQDSQLIHLQNYSGKIWIVDYFFTTCEGICPIMKTNMHKILDSFKNDDEVMFLSHTVQPEYDSVSILKKFSSQYGDIKNKWNFVTGDKSDLYKRARDVYFIAEPTDALIEEDFVHSQLFVLIDKNAHIRGFYDGTNTDSVSKLIRDIKLLKNEYK
jgi:protein SCO1/2